MAVVKTVFHGKFTLIREPRITSLEIRVKLKDLDLVACALNSFNIDVVGRHEAHCASARTLTTLLITSNEPPVPCVLYTRTRGKREGPDCPCRVHHFHSWPTRHQFSLITGHV